MNECRDESTKCTLTIAQVGLDKVAHLCVCACVRACVCVRERQRERESVCAR